MASQEPGRHTGAVVRGAGKEQLSSLRELRRILGFDDFTHLG